MLRATRFHTVFLLSCNTEFESHLIPNQAASKGSVDSGSSWEQLINLWIFVSVVMIMKEHSNCASVFLDFKVATVGAIS